MKSPVTHFDFFKGIGSAIGTTWNASSKYRERLVKEAVYKADAISLALYTIEYDRIVKEKDTTNDTMEHLVKHYEGLLKVESWQTNGHVQKLEAAMKELCEVLKDS
jgi:alpha-L-arabinofuranosidase